MTPTNKSLPQKSQQQSGSLKVKVLLKIFSVIVIIGIGVAGWKILGSTEKSSNKRELKPIVRMVETFFPAPQDVTLIISGNGIIRSENDLEIVSAVSGKIVFLKNNLRNGTFVNAGDILVEIDARQAANKVQLNKASLINSVVSLLPDLFSTTDRKPYRRWKQYLDQLNVEKKTPPLPTVESSREKIKVSVHKVFTNYYNLKNAEITLSHHTIYAPFSGTITESEVIKNSFVGIGQRLTKLVDPKNLEVSVPISISEFNRIDTVNQPKVKVFSADNNEVSLSGRVIRNDTLIKQGTQSVNVFVSFKNPQLIPEFFPGNYISLSIEGKTLRNVLLIPRYIIKEDSQIYTYQDHMLASEKIDILAFQNEHAIIANNLKKKTEVVLTILQKPLIGMPLIRLGDTTKPAQKPVKQP